MIGELVSHYRILSKLGGGGMGVVYEAEDLNLGRRLALKFLPEEMAKNPEMIERFRREARSLSALNHPHICVVHELGEYQGKTYIAMELMQGQTLRHLAAGKRLAVERVLELGAQIADGLDAAHVAGIVHRDVKPANIFVTERGEAKLLDFGLAKMDERISGIHQSGIATQAASGQLTNPGTMMGTVAYMSPEQARAEDMDGRTDIFSLGVVLFELATGRLPFEGNTHAEIFNGILSHDPPRPSSLNPDISPKLEEILLKALEKDRTLRYQHASDLKADLKRLKRDTETFRIPYPPPEPASATKSWWSRPAIRGAGALALVLSLAFGGLWLARRDSGSAAADSAAPKRIAVLPFENVGAPEDGYFADGMTDEVRSKLSSLVGLSVIASTSSNQYKGSPKPGEQIAKELGVRYLLAAKVRWQKAGNTSRIRVTPELVEIGRGVPVIRWQEAFDADLQDVFRVQGDIATKVAQAMELVLSGQDKGRLEARPTANLAAYDAYLKGREITKAGQAPAVLRRAAAKFDEAVALDPNFALAWARLARVHQLIYFNGVPIPAEGEAARGAAEKALALAPALPEAHGAMGAYYFGVTKDFPRAREAFANGLRLAPNHGELLRASAILERTLGHWPETLAHLERARGLDPRNFETERYIGGTLLRLRRPKDAREAIDRGLALAPENLDLIEDKALTYLEEGDLAGARSVMAAVPASVTPTALVAGFAQYWDLDWVLDEAQRDILMRLEPGSFGDDRGNWGMSLAQAASRRGDTAHVKLYAEEARKVFAEATAQNPQDAQYHALLGLALAYLGRGEEAVKEGELGLSLRPPGKDAWIGPYLQHLLVRIHILLGHNDKALDLLEPLMKTPYWLTPAWLRIDPNFVPLRGNPRFEKLMKATR